MMKDLKSKIALDEEKLSTQKYILSKYPNAVLGSLDGEEVYLVDGKVEDFQHIRFTYDAAKAEYFVRPYIKLKRRNKPAVTVYSTIIYSCAPKVVVQFLNDKLKDIRFEDLPSNFVKALQSQNTIPTPPRGMLERGLNMFASPRK